MYRTKDGTEYGGAFLSGRRAYVASPTQQLLPVTRLFGFAHVI